MGKRDEKITRAAHIKKHTRGTSNEISFSVLDAAKNALDGDDGDQDGHPFFGRIVLFTLPGRHKKPAGTPKKERGLPLSTGDFVSVEDGGPTAKLNALPVPSASSGDAASKPLRNPEEEIARRKARRRLSKAMGVLVVVAATVALAVAGGGYLYHEYQIQQGHISVLDEALNLVKETNDPLTQLHEAVSSPFEEGSSAARASVRKALTSVDDTLRQADEKARAVSVELSNSRDKEAANQTVITIAARRSLIEQGELLMNAADDAETASERVDTAWQNVLKGDDLAREAAELIADTTAENVEASKAKTVEALAALDEARAGFVEAQSSYGIADFSPFIDYIEKRQESLGYAIASDDALLAKNKEEATAQNNAYNIADAEAATLAKALPADPTGLVDEAFASATAEASKAYSTARLQAAAADAFITDYLGA